MLAFALIFMKFTPGKGAFPLCLRDNDHMIRLRSQSNYSAVAVTISLALTLSPAHAFGQLFWNTGARLTKNPPSFLGAAPTPSLNITGSFTLECWIRPDTNTLSGAADLIAKGSATNGLYGVYELLLENGRLRVGTNGNAGLLGKARIPGRIWTHVAATYDSLTGTFSTYVNGAADSTAVIPGSSPQFNYDSLLVGTGPGGTYAGDIDEVRIWNRALPADEIRSNMHSSLATTGGRYGNLMASYAFQRPYATPSPFLSLADWSGNGNFLYPAFYVTPVESRSEPPTYVSTNQSLNLDGTGSYAAGPSTPEIDISGSFTLECWVYPRGSQQSATLLQKQEGNHAVGYGLSLLNGHATLITNGQSGAISPDIVPAGRWTHVAGAYNAANGTFTLFLNGRADTTVFSGASPQASTDSLFIGTGSLGAFNGYVDEVRISDYAKTESQIRSFLYCSVEYSNVPPSPPTSIVYNFDGSTQTATKVGPALTLFGNAQFSSPAYYGNVPLAPLIRADDIHFPDGFSIKQSGARIPGGGATAGTLADSLNIPQSASISDIKLFIALNHSAESTLQISLIDPSHDSVMVDDGRGLAGTNRNLITIFNDAAPRSITESLNFIDFAPTLRPVYPLQGTFGGKDARGTWVLRINDTAPGDTGRLYAWGIQINNQSIVGVTAAPRELPEGFILEQNYPNPFNPVTTIHYSLPRASHVLLTAYDVLGRKVATLRDQQETGGEHAVVFDASVLASGVYFYILRAGTFTATRKLVVVR
jgi:subtilisin-like proprotein convertase family protein